MDGQDRIAEQVDILQVDGHLIIHGGIKNERHLVGCPSRLESEKTLVGGY